jgi:hypothetical protein
VPPQFSDLKFHNTGAAQDEYDALHGDGAFMQLIVPSHTEREAAHDRWLPPTPQHPEARGPLLTTVTSAAPGRTDLGVWNVYRNPDFPAPQDALERLLNPGNRLMSDEALKRSIGRFKTTSVRNLGRSAPYLHTGHSGSIEDVILFYQRLSSLARGGRMRNAPPEFFEMRLGAEDVAPLAAFLRALNEDYHPTAPPLVQP